MKVCLPQLVRTIGSCKIIASASFDKNEDYTITSDVKFKISFPGQNRNFCIITQQWKCPLFERVFRSNRFSASVDKLLGGKLSRTLAALF